MITPDDVKYHDRDPEIRTWVETMPLLFNIPEASIAGIVYVLTRPNLGAAISSIAIAQGICRQEYEIDFIDSQMHLTAPADLSDFTLENGLSVKATNPPRDFHFTYQHELGACSFDLNFRGLHQPFDIHDPMENVLMAASDTSNPADGRFGDPWKNGHFELKGHITGTLELRGKTYEVDCYDGTDHSWGPRSEVSSRAESYLSVAFGEDFGMQLSLPLSIDNGEVRYDPARFGFVLEDGQMYGIVEASVETPTRVDMIGMSQNIRAVDVRGEEHILRGTAIAGFPYNTFNPVYIMFQTLYRYEYRGRIGYGQTGDIFGTDYIAGRLSRHRWAE
ncbi:MAG TPA: hypothetical protein PK781_00045 [Terrimesophilobacter sp.]|nr:hypothetical protein [Terrimesophilobacter sp.]